MTDLRAPAGNNGNLKKNWSQEIRDFSRTSNANVGKAGRPSFTPISGDNPDKVARRDRSFRHEIRDSVKELALLKTAIKKQERQLRQQQLNLAEAEAIAALAAGTSEENDANAEVSFIQGILGIIQGSLDAQNGEADSLYDEIEAKKALLQVIVQARYEA